MGRLTLLRSLPGERDLRGPRDASSAGALVLPPGARQLHMMLFFAAMGLIASILGLVDVLTVRVTFIIVMVCLIAILALLLRARVP